MAEFIITAVNIFILFFLVGYFGSGMVSKFLAKRKAGIVESIDSAAAQKEAATKNLKAYQEKVKNFESERQQILERAAQREQNVGKMILLQRPEKRGRTHYFPRK